MFNAVKFSIPQINATQSIFKNGWFKNGLSSVKGMIFSVEGNDF